MTVPTGTMSVYAAIGNREDLTDLIVNISPTSTPVLSMTERTRANAVLHEWQTDALKAAAQVARVEGDDANIKTITVTARLNNYTQIIDNNFIVSATQEAVKHAGRGSEVEYQTTKAMKEIANDIEYALVVNSAAASAGDSSTARTMKGIRGWIVTNSNTATAATATRSFTAALIDAQLSAVWLLGGQPDTLLIGNTAKLLMVNTTNFPGMTRNVQAQEGVYKMYVDIYQGAIGGSLKVVPSITMSNVATMANSVFGLEIAKWRPAFLRDITRTPLAKTGDGQKFQIVAELTLEALQEKANFRITDLA